DSIAMDFLGVQLHFTIDQFFSYSVIRVYLFLSVIRNQFRRTAGFLPSTTRSASSCPDEVRLVSLGKLMLFFKSYILCPPDGVSTGECAVFLSGGLKGE
ncbi:MAG: hypothetical protein LUE22_00315, partial [Oscillospiraceae bacterium]|nr:hypothetical protein [Oscillospiraceae bacterium]